ncbi:MAG: hypothetical protein RL111_1469 [Pseudomonadota bacterium]
MIRFLSLLVAGLSVASVASSANIAMKKKEGNLEFTFTVTAQQIEKAAPDTIRFPLIIEISEPLQAKDITYQTIAAQVRLNCKDGSGEVASFELFKGLGPGKSLVGRSTAAQKFANAQHAYLGKELAFPICQQAAMTDLVSPPGAALRAPITIGGTPPSTLELRVLQSRLYSTNAKNFGKAVKELCENGAGTFIPIGSDKINCVGTKAPLFADFVQGVGSFTVDLDTEDPKNLGVRVRITDGLSRPTYDARIYTALYKELSETLGILDIPIQKAKVE